MQKTELVAGQVAIKKRTLIVLALLISLFCLVIAAVVFFLVQKPKPPIQVKLSDGRILQIEGVTYGTHHRMGKPSVVVERFGRWLPKSVNKAFGAEQRENSFDTERPALVVWVNALEATGKTNVDCQGIRVEFVNKAGDLFGEETSTWFGGSTFWRVGHVFYSYPRDEHDLNWQVTSWKKIKGKKNEAVSTQFENPHVVEPARWRGLHLPQSKTIGDVKIILKSLTTRTNGLGKKVYYETPTRYFEPVWEFQQNGQPVLGWEKPEWIAEDAIGNRGQFLGIHSPALKFFATAYPQATNAAPVIATLQKINPSALKTNLWWNKKALADDHEITVLGLFPSGTHTFSEGIHESSSPTVQGVRGGAPSGWKGTGKQLNPLQTKYWDHHYTPHPVIYIQCSKLNLPNRLAIRLQDAEGQLWVAEPEPGGAVDGIYPFLVDLPKTITNVVAEVVLLKPLQADFLVQTPFKD